MKLLHLVSSLSPHGGGITEGVLQLMTALAEQGHDGEVLTLDPLTRPFLATFPAKVHVLGPSRGRYYYNSRLLPWLRANASHYDALIVNGLWQYPGLAALRSQSASSPPYFVFTHGMLAPWFKHRYPLKHLKKWLYWPWADYRVLRRAAAVLFTCEQEKLLARQSFWLYKCREAVVSFGTADPPSDAERLSEAFHGAYPQLKSKRLFLFLGRIHEVKACDLLIEGFASATAGHEDVHLVMAGPDSDHWVPALQRRAAELGIAERITWTGMLSGDLKWGAFHASEVFCLPSHQENFGVAVAEALACSCPVLISDKVNIWREVRDDNAGLVESDDLAGVHALLTRWLAKSGAERLAMKAVARRCFENRFRMDRVASNLIDVIKRYGKCDDDRNELPGADPCRAR